MNIRGIRAGFEERHDTGNSRNQHAGLSTSVQPWLSVRACVCVCYCSFGRCTLPPWSLAALERSQRDHFTRELCRLWQAKSVRQISGQIPASSQHLANSFVRCCGGMPYKLMLPAARVCGLHNLVQAMLNVDLPTRHKHTHTIGDGHGWWKEDFMFKLIWKLIDPSRNAIWVCSVFAVFCCPGYRYIIICTRGHPYCVGHAMPTLVAGVRDACSSC